MHTKELVLIHLAHTKEIVLVLLALIKGSLGIVGIILVPPPNIVGITLVRVVLTDGTTLDLPVRTNGRILVHLLLAATLALLHVCRVFMIVHHLTAMTALVLLITADALFRPIIAGLMTRLPLLNNVVVLLPFAIEAETIRQYIDTNSISHHIEITVHLM